MKTIRISGGGVVKLDIDKLESIRNVLVRKMVSQVGVLGSKAQGRKETAVAKSGHHKKGKQASAMSNAEIGLVHEKGSLSRGIPRRSFLLMPLQQKADGLLKAKDWLWRKFLAGDRTRASLKAAYTNLGILAENVVQKAFMTGGFGKWAKLSDQTITRKKSSAILIDTAQLRRSIDSRVVEK